MRPEITRAGDAAALAERFNGKCAYCEARMAHVSNQHIEHYRPRSRFPAQMFEWGNWLLSCGRCNEKKWASFPYCGDEPCLIDPCAEDPYPHLHFKREQILHASYRGYVTIKLLGLDRPPLDKERAQWLLYLDLLLLLVASAEPASRSEARSLLIWAMQPEAPYKLMSYCYLRQRTPRLADPVAAHPRVEIEDPASRIEALLDSNRALLRALL